MSADDTLTLDPTPIPASPRGPGATTMALGQREAARHQSLRSAYLRAVEAEAGVRAAANRTLMCGALFLVMGLTMTLATYSRAATGGGLYVAAWAPVVLGLVLIVRGLTTRP